MYKVLAVQPASMNARGRKGKCNGLRTETSPSSIPKTSVLVDNGRSIISSAQQFLSRKRPDETKAVMSSNCAICGRSFLQCLIWKGSNSKPVVLLNLSQVRPFTSLGNEQKEAEAIHLAVWDTYKPNSFPHLAFPSRASHMFKKHYRKGKKKKNQPQTKKTTDRYFTGGKTEVQHSNSRARKRTQKNQPWPFSHFLTHYLLYFHLPPGPFATHTSVTFHTTSWGS